jgi:hypothetical protein
MQMEDPPEAGQCRRDQVTFPIDISARVSDELSLILESAVNDPDADAAPTLGSVRRALADGMFGELFAEGRLHFDDAQSVFAELEALIERYGEDAPAVDFVGVKASDDLSVVIEAVTDTAPDTVAEDVAPKPITLGEVRQAMLDGLVARLVGEGAIDPDEDETLLAEIDTLIEHFGADAPAENFLRYE